MHIFQKRILDQLRSQSSARYSELQPKDIESSHFKYHLDELRKAGLVEQIARGTYALSDAGKAAVDRLSAHTVNPKLTPKVITYTLLTRGNQYYLQRKQKEPYLGLLNMIGGKVHLGEATSDAAIREVTEKTGLQLARVNLGAIAEIMITSNTTLLSHVIAYVYTAELTSEPADLIGFDDTALAASNLLAPDTLDIIRQINIKSPALVSIVKTI